MSCDANFETIAGGENYAIVQAVFNQQLPPEGYKVDWRKLLNMNLPAQAPVAYIKAKQVLAGKATSVDTLTEEFPKLVNQWKEETACVSSLTKIYAHPAYQRIMAMGEQGIPYVLKELQKNQGHWFYALKFMAGINISCGMDNFEDAKAAWLEWGYKNNYI
jgi:hypothetical protein